MSKEPNSEDTFYVLKELEEHDGFSQRKMAEYHGYSLGKMNFILRALIGKGFVKVVNFANSKHKIKYRYVLTPPGIKIKYRLAQEFLKRKELEYEKIRQELEDIREYLDHSEG